MKPSSSFIMQIPKAELHLHIEGTLEPELMFALAKRNGIALPYASIDEIRAAYDFGNLQDFLDVYYQGAAVLQKEEDFCDLTFAYLAKAHTQGVAHAEIFFDPETHTARGIAFDTVVAGISRALDAGCTEFGITSKLILCFLRHLDASSAMATLEDAARHTGAIFAVGLDSSERGNPPSKFVQVFAKARELGFHVTAHAGEEGPAAYVHEALDLLHAERIDHGNHALDDEALSQELARRQIPLTVCPLSNLKLRVIADMRAHPLRTMLDKGLLVSINSDDPAYFGGYVGDNYQAVADALDLDQDDIIMLAKNSFRSSFLTQEEQQTAFAKIDAFVATEKIPSRD